MPFLVDIDLYGHRHTMQRTNRRARVAGSVKVAGALQGFDAQVLDHGI